MSPGGTSSSNNSSSNNNQQSKCLNEKRRREQENTYIEELAELIADRLCSMSSLSVKPDKCAILQEAVKQIRIIKKQETRASAAAAAHAATATASSTNVVVTDVSDYEAGEDILSPTAHMGTSSQNNSSISSQHHHAVVSASSSAASTSSSSSPSSHHTHPALHAHHVHHDLQASEVSSTKPSIIANEVLGPLLLEALDGFIFVVDQDGIIEFVSENVNSFIKFNQVRS